MTSFWVIRVAVGYPELDVMNDLTATMLLWLDEATIIEQTLTAAGLSDKINVVSLPAAQMPFTDLLQQANAV